jgi:hypothetical protein
MNTPGDIPWKLPQIEFARAISLGSDERYAYTVNKVREHGELYCLCDDDGWCLGLDPDGKLTFPIWPHPAFPTECAVGEWGRYSPVAIKLADFLSRAVEPIVPDDYPLAVFTALGSWVPAPFTHFKAHVLGPRQNHYDPPKSVPPK